MIANILSHRSEKTLALIMTTRFALAVNLIVIASYFALFKMFGGPAQETLTCIIFVLFAISIIAVNTVMENVSEYALYFLRKKKMR